MDRLDLKRSKKKEQRRNGFTNVFLHQISKQNQPNCLIPCSSMSESLNAILLKQGVPMKHNPPKTPGRPALLPTGAPDCAKKSRKRRLASTDRHGWIHPLDMKTG